MPNNKIAMSHFCWIDIATPDPDGTKIFFQKIFNWQYHNQPMPDGSVYTMISARAGGDVGGLYQMPDEMKAAGVPPHINNYIAVESVDKSVQNAEELGATVKMAPFDVFDYGRMAVLNDPIGAAFALWQVEESSLDCESHLASHEVHGMFCWQELLTSDVERASSFYKALLGWDLHEMDMGGVSYTVIKNQGADIGGIMTLPAEMQQVPPHWGTYFTVTNIDETIEAVKTNSGKVIMGPQEIPQTGQFAVCQAPDGTAFCLFEDK